MKRKALLLISIALSFCLLFTGCAEGMNVGNAEIKYKIDADESKAVVRELPNKTNITELVIDDTVDGVPVTEIADFAGCNLESVEKITIGKNVEKIGVWAFENNQSLKEFAVNPENEFFCSVDGVLFTKDMKELLFYPSSGATEYAVPEGVEIIRSKAFYKCDKIESITLPSTLKSIEEKAFFKCSSAEKITIPQGVEKIGKDAFGYCTGLTEAVIPSSVVSIGDYAFFNCTNLKSVVMNCDKNAVTLGKDWQPTNNGLKLDGLEIVWNE